MRSPPSVATGLFAGRYAIEREIGQGASAIVYLARDTQAGTAVALKILRPELVESRASDRFLREIKRTSALQHPNILPVLDAGDHEGQLYFALPYMEGGSLRDLLKREKRLEFPRILEIARTVAEALDHAHERGLIHRDVKPENILFTGGQACLGDFGIARAIDLSGSGATGTTSRNVVRGTPAYMSPEQAAGSQELDGRSDVFSLACVIYEMISGMQAYIGPTDEAVIAMRFVHPPRDLSVYRPTVPVSLNDAMQKAFALTPADRYRTAADLADAVDRAVREPPANNAARIGARSLALTSRRGIALTFGAVASLIAIAVILSPRGEGAPSIDAVDTTRVVLLPLDRSASSALPSWRDDDLLQQSFRRWRDVQVVDQFLIADVIRRMGPIESNGDAAELARTLRAGRYVRSVITPLDSEWHVSASLYDVGRDEPLYSARERIPAQLDAALAAYARVADSLLLRGAAADELPVSVAGSRSLAAQQAFGQAQIALDEWDLEQADSLFQVAVNYDSLFARANFWLAQVRAWQDRPRDVWGTVADRATTIVGQLDQRETQLANALVLLSRASYDSACAMYADLARRYDRDFAAWFGLGQCRMMDKIVVPSAASPSRWRFRSSAHRAMLAYKRAFELLPSVHRGYERGAFEQLRVLLLVATTAVTGFGIDDSTVFYARPAWMHDTLALIPYRWQDVFAGGRRTIPPGFQQALEKRREDYRAIAAGWSAVFPRNPGPKVALAQSMELLGNSAALDTLRSARALARDSAMWVSLAASEVLLLAKFGIPDEHHRLQAARILGDSLLRLSPNARNAEDLAPVAALLGRCDEAERLAYASVAQGGTYRVSRRVVAEAQATLVRLALRCGQGRSERTTKRVAAMIESAFPRTSDERARVQQMFLTRLLLLDQHLDSLMIERMPERSTPLLRAARFIVRHERDSARVVLRAMDSTEVDAVGTTPDVALAKALLWLTISDTTAAVAALDGVLEDMNRLSLTDLKEPATAASLNRALSLRADLSAGVAAAPSSARWRRAISSLRGPTLPQS